MSLKIHAISEPLSVVKGAAVKLRVTRLCSETRVKNVGYLSD